MESEVNQDELNKSTKVHFHNYDKNVFISSKELHEDLKKKKENIKSIKPNNENNVKNESICFQEKISLSEYCHFKNFKVEHPVIYNSSSKITFIHSLFSWRKYSVKLDEISLFGIYLGENESSYSILRECLKSITYENKEESFSISKDNKQLEFSLLANLSKNEIKIPINIKFIARLDYDKVSLEKKLKEFEESVIKKHEKYNEIKNNQINIRKEISKQTTEYGKIYDKLKLDNKL
jgi:hypothetical protein